MIDCADPAACEVAASQIVEVTSWMVVATIVLVVAVEGYRFYRRSST